MIRITLARDPYWIDLSDDVGVLVRPISTTVFEAAKAVMAKDYAAARETDGGILAVEPSAADGVLLALWGLALLRVGGLDWRGVCGEDGAPLAFSADAAGRFAAAAPLHLAEFVRLYTAPLESLAAEGNVFAPGSNTTSATAPDSASPAAS